MKRTMSKLFLSSLLLGTMGLAGMAVPVNAAEAPGNTSASRGGGAENQKDYSTSEAAMEYLSFGKTVKNIDSDNPELAVYIADQLEKQALKYTDAYAKERTEKVRKLYSKRFGSFDTGTDFTSARQIDNYVNTNWDSWIAERTKLVGKKIDDAENISAVYAVLLAANHEAHLYNAETAKKIIADLPAEERAGYEAVADELIKYEKDVIQPLIDRGMPSNYKDVPKDWNAIPENELEAASKEADKRKLKQKNDTIVASVTKAHHKSVKLPAVTFTSKTVKKLFGNWFDSKHPYYLNDMMRNVLPKLDTDMQKLEQETVVVSIPKGKTDLRENGTVLQGISPADGMRLEDGAGFVSKAAKQGKYRAKAVLLPKSVWSGIEAAKALMNDPANSELRNSVLGEITKPYREITWEIKAKEPVPPAGSDGNTGADSTAANTGNTTGNTGNTTGNAGNTAGNTNNTGNTTGGNIRAIPQTGSNILNSGALPILLASVLGSCLIRVRTKKQK